MKTLVLFICLLAFVGCSKREDIALQHIQSPLTKDLARNYAKRLAMYSGGWVVHTRGNSMGTDVSDYAYVVLIDEWSLTQKNDVIAWTRSADQSILHKVIVNDKDAMRTKGTGNSRPDWVTVFEQNYEGTMIAQVYYRNEL